ncbi:Phosphoenolpyruvate/pyruvate domain-containing protein [Trichocladium antarcticum]|uniref:Phosphoenolpyruvate/pyruvate domain-containing protein n=1 Tax=Trichocladium antarcticum TaxID=1450529 RepID=A0AAN6UGQ7_9PEZI|nr:Phosphoenolpyruvate/pyruvate domain-containing protein [Trichocladium antarcticum]
MTPKVSRLWSAALQRPHPRAMSTMDPSSKMARSNRLQQVLAEATRPAMGFWQMLPGANISRILARSGADWILVDCEHGNIDDAAMHEAVPAIAALGVSPIVRLPDLQPWMVKRALDSGAHGILVPLIRTVKEVKDVVAAAKFPPQGQRGFGSPFALQSFEPGLTQTEYLQQANESLLTIVQIETQEALDAVGEIAPLVDALFVGPFDLGNNIGHPVIGDKMDPELVEAIAAILKATVAAGKKCGIYCTSDSTDLAWVHSPQFLRVKRVILQDCKSRQVTRMAAEECRGELSRCTDQQRKICVHQGCGKVYTDADEVCRYHPGPPIFHEGQKGWKCCKPRVLTFEEFMTIEPCTEGKHSTTDLPPKVEKRAADPAVAEAASSFAAPPPRAPVVAPQHIPTPPPPPQPESEEDDETAEIPDGRVCRRRACGATYKTGSGRDGETCVHHPGAPLFHEGSKGYTCCKRRVLEFDQFMKIEGCQTKNRHLFVGSGKDAGAIKGPSKDGGEELLETVRNDFYQTQTSVIASFFLKKIDKEAAKVEFRERELVLDLPTTDAPAPKRYKAHVPLYGLVDPAKSTFKIFGTKLEVSIAKADGSAWPVLRSDDPLTGEIFQIGRAGRA